MQILASVKDHPAHETYSGTIAAYGDSIGMVEMYIEEQPHPDNGSIPITIKMTPRQALRLATQLASIASAL